jgi:hypothetical protein
LVIAVTDYNGDFQYTLQYLLSSFSGTMTGIPVTVSELVNQTWSLWAGDWYAGDTGYIDYWWIKVYYTAAGGYCGGSGGCNDAIEGMLNIDSVTVGDISNTETGCGGSYSDYTHISTEMVVGQGYPITVTNGNAYDDDDQCGVWVDWNQDDDFYDSGEEFTMIGGPETFTGTITPPGGASLGDTRMRVRVRSIGTLSPCGYTTYGEVEDYNVTVVAAGVTISGYVETSGAVGIDGVLVSASTGETDTTNSSGYYELDLDNNWTGNITPTKSGWSFDPTFRSYSNVTSDITTADFTGTPPPAPVISGYVKTGSGTPIRDTQISGTNGIGSTSTGSDGYYELTAPSNPWSGTITPSRDQWDFSPVNREYTDLASDVTDANYTGTYTADPTPLISGYVKTADGNGVDNVEIWADDFAGRSILTDANGYYEISIPSYHWPIPEPWDVNITPHKTDWIFDPERTVYVNLISDMTNQNYTATYIGGGCDAGWIEEWVALYHADEKYNYADESYRLAVDKAGNVCVTGQAYSKLNGIYSWNSPIVMYNSSGQIVWQTQYDGPASDYDEIEDIFIDDNGDIYVTGTTDNESSPDDLVTIKYTTDSNEPNWVAFYNGPDNYSDRGKEITVDDDGYVYVTGYSSGVGTEHDYVTIKYDPNGSEVWPTPAIYNGPANGYDEAVFVDVDDFGNVYVTGNSVGIGTEYDWAIIKYDPNGNEEWVKRYNGPANNNDIMGSLAFDSEGYIYAAGMSNDPITGDDFLMIKYDPNGSEVWKARYDGPDSLDDGGGRVLIDQDDNIYVNGITNSSGFFTTGDLLLLKFVPDSNEPVWAAIYDGTEELAEFVAGMDIDKWGNIYIGGLSNIIPGDFPDPPQGNYVAIKYAPDSNEPVWVAEYKSGRPFLDRARDIAVDDYGNVYMTGYNDASVTVKYSQCYIPGDCYQDYFIDGNDLEWFSGEWLRQQLIADFAFDGGDGIVNFADWAAFARAWQSTAEPLSPNWDPECDIAPQGGDGIIDAQDMIILINEWLNYNPACADIAPLGNPDGIVNVLDYAVFANSWLTGVDELYR